MRIVVVVLVLAARAGFAAEVESIGGCLLIDVRPGSSSAGAHRTFDEEVRADCLRRPAAPNMEVYEKAYAQLIVDAFDVAEVSLCGRRSCASGERRVRVALLLGAPNAGVLRNEFFLEIFVHTSLIHQAEAAFAASLSRESDDLGSGLVGYLDRMRSYGFMRCNAAVIQATRLVDSQIESVESDRRKLLGAALQTYLTFVFAHEIAHDRLDEPGGVCGSSSANSLDQESACDKYALSGLSQSGRFYPAPAIAAATALDVHHALFEPLLVPPRFRDFDLVDLFPAVDWNARARRSLDEWRLICSGGSTNAHPNFCTNWKQEVEISEFLLQLGRGAPCRDPESALPDSAGYVAGGVVEIRRDEAAIRECVESRTEPCVQTCKSSFGHNEETCRRRFCGLSAGNSAVWKPACRREIYGISSPEPETIQQASTGGRSARLEIVPGSDSLVRSGETFCQDVAKVIAAANDDFDSLRGEKAPREEGDDFDVWVSRFDLAGTSDCEVWNYDDLELTPRFQCDGASRGDQAKEYQRLAEAVTKCLSSASWEIDESESTRERRGLTTYERELVAETRGLRIDLGYRRSARAGRTMRETVSISFDRQ